MNLINVLKIGVACAALVFSYWIGVQQGRESEELKNARAEISTLTTELQEHKAKQKSDAIAISNLRVAESASRDELDRMRKQLSEIEKRDKSGADRERNRCLSYGIRCQDALERAARAVKFCAENHK